MRGPSCQPSQRYKEAAEDFITITRELIELRTIASTLQRDCDDSSASSIPVELRPQTAAILKNCDAVVLQVQGLVDKYMSSGKTGAAKWALRGKEDVAKLQVSLETHCNALGLTLGMISVSLTKAVKDDTTVIKEGMAEVREIATHVLKGVETLRKLEGAEQPGDRLDLGGRFMKLERYLDDMTSYADTVIGEDFWDDAETRSIEESSENRQDGHDSQRIIQAGAQVVQSNTAANVSYSPHLKTSTDWPPQRTFVERKCPPEYLLPSGIDHYHATLDVGCELSLSIMDSPGSEDWERSRKNAFRWDEPDLFLICVDLGDPGLFGLAEENVRFPDV
ncbi:hypothetical protein CEP51_005314 [Fusarium floridanum]|uniref:Fungal N-terminal domain-containing protein n=1 Tax=Fusarium floridanum TaxID=1325733 RepID=A0A428RXS8_9HYPO|nr:hypothetical protein CEP51_005314 [Fusarium floridanum]